jgi:hypothetical protein
MALNIPPAGEGDKLGRLEYLWAMRVLIPALLLLTLGSGLGAQSHSIGSDGRLTGVIQDSATGEPVGYALVSVVGGAQQVFATAAGRFRLEGLGPGRITLRLKQIGYRPTTLALNLERAAAFPGGDTALVIRMTRQALQLPELVAEPEACIGMRNAASMLPEVGGLLEEAFANAERILTIEKSYPFVLHYQRSTTQLDSSYTIVAGEIDTIRKESRRFAGYRPGQVLDRAGTRPERINAFTASDIAQEEFQRRHCFWFAGRDSVAGMVGFRIDFAPHPEVRSTDWAGSILVDSLSLALLKTEARVVNLPERGSDFFSVVCSTFYRPLAPSLPQEHEVRCSTAFRGPPRRYQVERWLLINRSFLARVPGAPGTP